MDPQDIFVHVDLDIQALAVKVRNKLCILYGPKINEICSFLI